MHHLNAIKWQFKSQSALTSSKIVFQIYVKRWGRYTLHPKMKKGKNIHSPYTLKWFFITATLFSQPEEHLRIINSYMETNTCKWIFTQKLIIKPKFGCIPNINLHTQKDHYFKKCRWLSYSICCQIYFFWHVI